MKLSLIPKSGNLSDPEATGNIVSLVVVVLLMSIFLRDYILLFLYEPIVAIIPGIHEASQAATHVDLAKSFWSFTWCFFPLFFIWVVRLASRVKDKVPVKKNMFFFALLIFLFLFLLGYEGRFYSDANSIRWQKRLYGESLFGMYTVGFCYWSGVYSCLFITLRFLTSWVRIK